MEENKQNNGLIGVMDQYYKGNSRLSSFMPESPIEKKRRIKGYLSAYLQRADGMIERMSSYECPVNIMDEFSIIVRESKQMLINDIIGMDGPFEDLMQYLNTQKAHLASIKSKVPPTSLYYEQISTLIVMVTMFHIEEGLSLFDNSRTNNGMMMSSNYVDELKKKKMLSRAWSAIECLDTYQMSYQFKYDIYSKKRDELKGKCRLSSVDVRTQKEKKKDAVESVSDDVLGCVFKIAMLVGIALILSLIFGSK